MSPDCEAAAGRQADRSVGGRTRNIFFFVFFFPYFVVVVDVRANRFKGRGLWVNLCWDIVSKVIFYLVECVLPSISWHPRVLVRLTLHESFDVSNIEVAYLVSISISVFRHVASYRNQFSFDSPHRFE